MVVVDHLRFIGMKDSDYRTKDQVQRRLNACAARQFDAQPAKWGRRAVVSPKGFPPIIDRDGVSY